MRPERVVAEPTGVGGSGDVELRGEILERNVDGEERRVGWFRLQEVELAWLPVRESAFLLWVLLLLALVWFVIGLVIRLS